MRYILLNNGTGVFRRDATRTKARKLELLFEGAPERSEVRFKYEGLTLSLPLINGEVTLDVSNIRGTLEATVISPDQRWKCDSLFIGEYKSGELFVATESCYGEKIATLSGDLDSLRDEVRYLKKMLLDAKKEFKIKKRNSEII